MSEKHLYERHLAEKLQQLSPPPDVETHWQAMKRLLDEDQPRGGGFKRWWRLGVIAGLLLIGGWLTGTLLLTTKDADKAIVAAKPNTANVDEKKSLPDNSQSANDKTKTPNGSGSTPPAGDATVLPADEKAGEKPGDKAVDKDLAPAGAPVNKPAVNTKTGSTEKDPVFSENNQSLATGEKTGNTSKAKAGKVVTKKDRSPVDLAADIGSNESVARRQPGKNNKNRYTTNNSTRNDITVLNDRNSNNTQPATKTKETRAEVSLKYSPLLEKINYTGSLTLAPADQLKTDFSSLNMLTKSALKSKSSRSGKNRSEKTFAIGFSLPLAFPLGDQKALSYNSNAGANTVSDYIPSPHLQYRLNSKTYLQTELQFMSPQHIRPILLYEQKMSQAGNYSIYNSIYARKLYYFNVPIGIHHSPFPNFYLGTGLQFSSLLGGVGLYEQTKRELGGQNTILLNEHYAKLNSDSLTSRLNTAEVRLMLEMNYYVNRFTVGLRYNQAFNNYANFRVNNVSPYQFDKNKALQFYLRYNLWEDLRRKNNNKGLLSSK